jgi:hypothetical protein
MCPGKGGEHPLRFVVFASPMDGSTGLSYFLGVFLDGYEKSLSWLFPLSFEGSLTKIVIVWVQGSQSCL